MVPDNSPIIFGISQYSGQSYRKGDSLNAVFDCTARIVSPGWTAMTNCVNIFGEVAFGILHDGGMNCTVACELFSLYRILKKFRKTTSTKIFTQFVIIGDHTTQIIATKSPCDMTLDGKAADYLNRPCSMICRDRY